jgi:branched-chain amino acid transport system permease protein
MFKQTVINRSLYLSAGFFILALTGVFGSFSDLSVIKDVLALSTVLFVVMVMGTAFYMAALSHEDDTRTLLANSVFGGLVVSVFLGLTTLMAYTVRIEDGETITQIRQWVRFTFPNFSISMFEVVLFGQGFMPGLLLLLLGGAVMGVLGAGLFLLPNRIRSLILSSLSFAVMLGLLQSQLIRIIPLADALTLLIALLPGYLIAILFPNLLLAVRAALGALVGAGVGLVALTLVNNNMIQPAQVSIVLKLTPLLWWLLLVGASFGLLGVTAGVANRTLNAGVMYFMTALLITGIMNWQSGMTLTAFVMTLITLVILAGLLPTLTTRSAQQRDQLPTVQRTLSQQTLLILALALAFIAPTFLGRSLTFALALVGIYIIMGIGLNIVVGFAGLLDLGHVGFFAIGAYTIGLLTSPTILTCGGIPASDVLVRDVTAVREVQELTVEQQTGNALFIEDDDTGLLVPIQCNVLNFWLALPIAVFAAGASGMILGVPVLRLRGDYLAIVTLGLSEIISIIIGASTFSHVFGSAQGISPIPSPIIDLSLIRDGWTFEFFSSQIYYLIVPGILFAVFISQRLVNSRVGRAWRSMRADEDVAEAMGIDLVRAKLSAFGISAAFAGLGGALFGAGLQGAFPNSFTLLVSINVLSMIIIGGLGSIPGVIVGALVLVGLPEILRELDDYRLLVFGMLLVTTMLLKPEGLIPPPIRKLSERATESTSTQPATGD